MTARNSNPETETPAEVSALSLGQVVLVVGKVAHHNGADVAPGIVTRVHDDGTVNVTVLPDGYTTRHATGVSLSPDEDTARESLGDGRDAAAYLQN